MVNDIFSNMEIPQLGDANFQSNFQNFCSAIVENIQRLISVQYVKGEAGSSVINRDVVVKYNWQGENLCPLGQSLVNTIFNQGSQPAEWTIEQVHAWLDDNENGVAPIIDESVVWPALTQDYGYTIKCNNEIIAQYLNDDPTDNITNIWEYNGQNYTSELIVEQDEITHLYRIIYYEDDMAVVVDEGLEEDPSDNIIKYWIYDNQRYTDELVVTHSNDINVSINIDEESHKAYLANPFILIDGRIVDLAHLGDGEDAESIRRAFIDFSTAVYGIGEYMAGDQDPNDPTTWTWTLHRVNIIPKIYYDDQIHEFCWNINGQNTGISAQGVTGEVGESIHTWVCKGDPDGGPVGAPIFLNITEVLDETTDGVAQFVPLENYTHIPAPSANDLALVFWQPANGIERVFFGPIRDGGTGGVQKQVKYLSTTDIFECYERHSVWYKMWLIDSGNSGIENALPSAPRGYILPDPQVDERNEEFVNADLATQTVHVSRSHMTWNEKGNLAKGKLISSPIEAANWVQTASGTEQDSHVQLGATGDWDINYNTNVQGNSCVQGSGLVQGNMTVQRTTNLQGELVVPNNSYKSQIGQMHLASMTKFKDVTYKLKRNVYSSISTQDVSANYEQLYGIGINYQVEVQGVFEVNIGKMKNEFPSNHNHAMMYDVVTYNIPFTEIIDTQNVLNRAWDSPTATDILPCIWKRRPLLFDELGINDYEDSQIIPIPSDLSRSARPETNSLQAARILFDGQQIEKTQIHSENDGYLISTQGTPNELFEKQSKIENDNDGNIIGSISGYPLPAAENTKLKGSLAANHGVFTNKEDGYLTRAKNDTIKIPKIKFQITYDVTDTNQVQINGYFFLYPAILEYDKLNSKFAEAIQGEGNYDSYWYLNNFRHGNISGSQKKYKDSNGYQDLTALTIDQEVNIDWDITLRLVPVGCLEMKSTSSFNPFVSAINAHEGFESRDFSIEDFILSKDSFQTRTQINQYQNKTIGVVQGTNIAHETTGPCGTIITNINHPINSQYILSLFSRKENQQEYRQYFDSAQLSKTNSYNITNDLQFVQGNPGLCPMDNNYVIYGDNSSISLRNIKPVSLVESNLRTGQVSLLRDWNMMKGLYQTKLDQVIMFRKSHVFIKNSQKTKTVNSEQQDNVIDFIPENAIILNNTDGIINSIQTIDGIQSDSSLIDISDHT